MSESLEIHPAIVKGDRYSSRQVMSSYGTASVDAVYVRNIDIAAVAKLHASRQFAALSNRWKRETINMSSLTDILQHPSYEAIIAMGILAVPMILVKLKDEPDHWFYALHKITGANPVLREHAGNVGKMTEAWLNWGRGNGY